MGFGELSDFNLALLAKLVLRAFNSPNVSWVQVLKGLYYPNVNFLNAKKGARSS